MHPAYSISNLASRVAGLAMLGCTAFASAAMLSSCLQNRGIEYSSFVDIGSGGIPSGWEFEFNPVPADSASIGHTLFDIILVVRYSAACRPRDLPLNLEFISLAGETPDSLALRIPLFNDDNEPLGKGIYSIYETSDTILRNVAIPEGYTISLSSPVETNQTEGIMAIGIVASRAGTPHTTKFIKNVW